MKLFRYDKPGPGIDKDEPKKKGLALFFQIVGTHPGDIVKLNLLFFLCLLPAHILLIVALTHFFAGDGPVSWLWFGAALAATAPAGPAYTAACRVLSRMLREEPGFLWHDFKAAFKDSLGASVVPGMLLSLFAGTQGICAVFYLGFEGISFVIPAMCLFSAALVAISFPYYFIQISYLDIRAIDAVKNSLLLSLAYLPRSFMGGLLGTGLVLAQYFLLPVSVPALFLFGYSLPFLINLMWIWPDIDKAFHIEQSLQERRRNSE